MKDDFGWFTLPPAQLLAGRAGTARSFRLLRPALRLNRRRAAPVLELYEDQSHPGVVGGGMNQHLVDHCIARQAQWRSQDRWIQLPTRTPNT